MARTRRERRAAARRSPESPAREGRDPLAGAGKATLAAAAAVGLVAFAIYLKTLAPTVTLVDSGELIVAAHGLGVAHPPGFPLWVMLAHAATRLPWGNIAARVHAASALFAALAAGLLVLAFRDSSLDRRVGRDRLATAWRWTDLVPPTLAGLLLACSRTLWAYATVAEVYTLNTLLVVLLLALLFRWRLAPGKDPFLFAAAAAFGLALGVHHATVALLLPALAVLVFKSAGGRLFRSRRFAAAAGISAAAFAAVYLYLPWAAARPTGLNWGNPIDLTRALWHVTGRQYQVFLAPTAESVRGELGDWASIVSRNWGPPWLPIALALALLGLRTLWKSDRTLFATLMTLIAANSGYGLLYTIAEDKDAYYLPTIAALAFAAGYGARAALEAVKVHRRALLGALLLALPFGALFVAWPGADRSNEHVAEDFVADTLQGIAANGLLLTGEWQLYSPLLYFREVENQRADVSAIDVQLLRRSWYYDFLARRTPELYAAARPAIELFLEDLHAWDREPDLYERDRALNQRINERFHAMILDLIARQLEHGPVYVTRDIALPPFAADPTLPPKLAALYDLVPRGLAFELRADRAYVEPGKPAFAMRGLFDRARPLDPKSVAALKVRPVYLTMIASRGFYLAAHGRTDEARAAFLETLALEPSFEPARQALARLP